MFWWLTIKWSHIFINSPLPPGVHSSPLSLPPLHLPLPPLEPSATLLSPLVTTLTALHTNIFFVLFSFPQVSPHSLSLSYSSLTIILSTVPPPSIVVISSGSHCPLILISPVFLSPFLHLCSLPTTLVFSSSSPRLSPLLPPLPVSASPRHLLPVCPLSPVLPRLLLSPLLPHPSPRSSISLPPPAPLYRSD